MTLLDRLLRPYSRVTSSGRWIPEVDGLRFVAIASVVLYHASEWLAVQPGHPPGADPLYHRVLAQGHIGVELFFVLSGFILALGLADRLDGTGLGLRHYYLRRLTRLEPPYVFSLIAAWLLIGGFAQPWLLDDLATGLVYAHGLVQGDRNPINPVTWSLEVEVQFYVLAPAIALVFLLPRARTRRALLVAAAALSVALQCLVVAPPGTRWAMTFAWSAQYFLTGFLLADLWRDEWKRPAAHRWAWDLAGVAAAVALPVAVRHDLEPTVGPVLLATIVAATFRGRGWNRALTNRVITTIGGMCYTIYLYHLLVIRLVGRALLPHLADLSWHAALAVTVAVDLAAILFVSAVLFVGIERPFMRSDLPRRLDAWFAARLAPKRARPDPEWGPGRITPPP